MTDAPGDTAKRDTLPTGPGRSRTPRLILAANFALAGLSMALSLAGPVGVTDPSAYVGTVLLVGSILPSNLLRFGRFAQDGRMRALARLRKPLGVSAGVWFVVHSVASVWEHFDLSLPLGPQFARTGIILGLVATLIFVLMLATSTGRAQRALGANWKRLHRLVWFAVPLSLAHALVTGGLEPPAIVLYGGIMAFAALEYRAQRGRGTDVARKHLALVGAGTLASVLIYAVL
ncbi:MAG TPA: ferric reductase-like transmembrane domain-containing protein [Rubrobacter sp.]|nr:ferric reductase-like transmembrane domain-containing protein [Rubrobacter sp.]